MPIDPTAVSGATEGGDDGEGASSAAEAGLHEPLLHPQPDSERQERPLSPTHRMNTAIGLWLMVISSLFFSLMTLLVRNCRSCRPAYYPAERCSSHGVEDKGWLKSDTCMSIIVRLA